MEKATLYLYMPPAPASSDTEAWLDFYFASVDKNGKALLNLESVKKFHLKESRPGKLLTIH